MPNVEKIYESLKKHGISEIVVKEIIDENNISCKCKKEEKAKYISEIINRMDSKLDKDLLKEIMEWCACSKTGSREKNIKQFVKDNKGKSISEKINNLNLVPFMGNPILNDDLTLSCSIIWKEGLIYKCPCPNFNGVILKEPVSKSYCYCCAGHYKHHYQNALGLKLKTKDVISTVLDSLGKKPCQFIYEIIEK